jgi:hypothetical protein
MITQPRRNSVTDDIASLPLHGFCLENCPTCGQKIPPDKFEEISGRIATRERERTSTVTAEIQKQYAAKTAAIEQQAKTDLELERQRSGARELRAREEARVQAERGFNQKLAENITKLGEAEAARVAAVKSESGLRAKLEEAEKTIAAKIAKAKKESTAEATERAELRFRDVAAGHEKALKEAQTKTREAEKRAHEVQQDFELQREAMEKAKEDAVNDEKAKSFKENQRLSNKVNELQRALDNKTNEELGEGAEVKIFEALKAEFKGDKIERIAKGAPGADIRHVVMSRGQKCGTILYDSKNHKQWRDEHASKLRRDQLADKAEHAILSTHRFPKDTRQVHLRDGIVLANPARVVALATIIRQHILQVHILRLSGVECERKTAALYEYITSARCRQLLERIEQRASTLLALQEKEIKWHGKNWEDQGTAIRAIQKAKDDLAGEVDSIIGGADFSKAS